MSSITITTTHKMHTQRDIEEALLGSWSLLEYFSDPFDGKGPSLHPMGPDARGMLTYHPDGRMSVHLMPSAKMKSRTAVNDGFIYTGRYWVELQELGKNSFMVCHRAELASLPYLEGMVQRRKVTLPDNNRLVMSFVGIEELDGLMVRPELVWERVSRPLRRWSGRDQVTLCENEVHVHGWKKAR